MLDHKELPEATMSKGKGKGKMGKGKGKALKPKEPPWPVSASRFGSEVRRLVLRAFTEEPEDDALTVPQSLYNAAMRSIPYIYDPPSSSFDVMPILPVSRIFTDEELDEHQLGRSKRKDPRQTIVSVPSIRLMPGLAHPLTFNEEQMLRLFVTDPRSMAYNLSNTQRSRVPLTVEQCETAHRIILERHEVLRSAFSLEDPTNPTRKVMRHHLGGFYALAITDETHAQSVASMDYATPHRCASDRSQVRFEVLLIYQIYVNKQLLASKYHTEPDMSFYRQMSRRWALLALAFFFAPATFVGPLRHYVAAPRRAVGVAAKTVTWLQEETWQEGPENVLEWFGVASLQGVFPKQLLEDVKVAFTEGLSEEEAKIFKFGELRTQRKAVHLPFREPFKSLPLLGKSNALLEPLSEYLGDDFILESALVITVDGGTEGQNAHTDTEARQETFLEDDGSISVHIPLQDLEFDFAPLSFCITTHQEVELLDTFGRQVRRWRPLGATKAETRQRLCAGHKLERRRMEVTYDSAATFLDEVDLMLGKQSSMVKSVTSEGPLQRGDEITHVNDLRFMNWYQIHRESPKMQDSLRLDILRPPHVAALPAVHEGPKLLVGAPLTVGDVMIYDSRIIHWGMANTESSPRHVLYLNFMSTSFEGYSPDGDAIAMASTEFERLGISGIRMLYSPSSDNFPSLHVNMHHILADNDALLTFWQESFQVQELLYYGYSKEAVKEKLPKLPVQFTDFAYWQKSLFSRGLLKPDLSYWGRQITNSQPPSVLAREPCRPEAARLARNA
eukprot:symbB.v1.2.024084.t1/scaffold2256.1/size84244/1